MLDALSVVEVETLAAFVPASLALILAPGPDTIYVLSQSVGARRRVGVAAAAGVSVGVLVHTAAAAVGLSVLLRESTLAFRLVKYLGAAYLVYLGVRTLRGIDAERSEPPSHDVDAGPVESVSGVDGTRRDALSTRAQSGFLRGVAVNVSNPKVALFFLAFLPQFVGGSGTTAQLATLGSVYATLTLAYLGGVALFATRVGALVGDGGGGRAFRWLSGGALLALGGSLFVETNA
ncbi:LysE family translocator [Haloprofundus sp. MHR1]|uniref:LysE family translocator n=1 Tax=Haloprofundus sp. MHR1 TaxID=2572921 RepID=UPI0010BF3B7B|nr:LysE family translocator [Haloprofundus sp. MHR1]QCJ47348.1 LysE family translocator [Haloprofundus sp. MHR1]